MQPKELLRLSPAIRRIGRSNALYNLLDQRHRCGPFDGGCAMIAAALKETLGTGEIVGLCDDRNTYQRWHHAVVQVGNFYVDADGVATFAQLRTRWIKVFNFWNPVIGPDIGRSGYRKEEVPYSQQTVADLVSLFIPIRPR